MSVQSIVTRIAAGGTPGAGPANPPQYKPEEYSTAKLVLDFFATQKANIAKTFAYTTFWLGEAFGGLPQGAKTFSTTMGDFKNFVSATEVPKKGLETYDSVKRLWTNRTGTWTNVFEAAREVFKKVTSLINSTVDTIDLSGRFIAIDKTVMSWLKGISAGATLGGSTNGAIEQIQNLLKTGSADTKKRIFCMINLARDVSYIAVGAIGFSAFIMGTAIVPWMIITALTSGLAFSIGSYFYEKINDPDGKGKNLDPEIVMQNHMARKAAGLV